MGTAGQRTRALSRLLLIAAVVSMGLLSTASLRAQANRDPLTPDQSEQIREYADNPQKRVKLYVRFIDERIQNIRSTAPLQGKLSRQDAEAQTAQIHAWMEEFTRLVDELQDNLDSYADHHEDVRKPLKELLDTGPKWTDALKGPPQNSEYEFVRRTAIEAAASLNDSAKKMLDDQVAYFAKHKPRAGGDTNMGDPK